MAPHTTTANVKLTSLPDAAQAKFCDTLDIDQEQHLLYAGDNWAGGLDVFDISSPVPKYIRTISLRGRLYGVAVAANVGKAFVGMSGSTLAVIDINPASATINTLVAQIHTGGQGHVDLVDYDPVHKRLYAANRVDGFMVSVDANTNEIVGRVTGLGTGLEQPRFNPADGMVYLTDNRANVLYQIDPSTNKLVNTFEIADACYPNGIAINPETNQAVLACSNRERPHTVIWDLNEQRIDSVVEDTGCGDGAMYEPTIDRFFFAAAGYSGGPVMGIFGGKPTRFLTNVPTMKGASWVAYDRKNKLVYAPAVQNGRPALISFHWPED
jgi:DNA-binding beta-propeller fold protein YncE